MTRILECHSKGDKRFSALYAQITHNGKKITIEKYYQSCKRDINGNNVSKGKDFYYLYINNKCIPKCYTSQFYDLLWVQYFLENPDLYDYACEFDDYRDIFAGKSINIQSNTIKRICKNGINSVRNDCKEFEGFLKSNSIIPINNQDIFNFTEDILGHQTNCKGVMGAGIAKDIRVRYLKVFLDYKHLCETCNPLGTVQLLEIKDNKYIANIFGQYLYGRNKKYTDYKALKSALEQLKQLALKNGLSVCLPYKIGCNNAGGDWAIVENIIKDVFYTDKLVPIIIYKKGE